MKYPLSKGAFTNGFFVITVVESCAKTMPVPARMIRRLVDNLLNITRVDLFIFEKLHEYFFSVLIIFCPLLDPDKDGLDLIGCYIGMHRTACSDFLVERALGGGHCVDEMKRH